MLAGALLVAVGIGAVALLPLVAEPAPEVREIVLVSRNMKFYLEGESTPNPTIRVEPGEQVRFVLRNADPGFVHWFAIDAWGVKVGPLTANETGSIVTRVPDESGRLEYSCTPHPRMMRGTVQVAVPRRLTAR